jgi:SNF2 family DNA or RNA helicase
MTRKFYRYQKNAARFLYYRERGALFAGVGTGKTAILLHTAFRYISEGRARDALVVAPIGVVKSVWEQEAAKWPMLEGAVFSRVLGSPQQRLAALKKRADFYLINYENLTWYLNLKGVRQPDILILDESTKIKNYASLRFNGRGKRKDKKTGRWTRAVRGLKVAASKFKFAFIMTGTPKPGEYEQLWSQIYVLDNGKRLGQNITLFRQEHYVQYGNLPYQRALKTGHDTIIQKKLKDICFRINEEDLDKALPKVVRRNNFIDLPSNVRSMYDEMEADAIIQLEDGEYIHAEGMGVKLNKLRQICQGALYREDGSWAKIHDEKLDMLDAMVEDLDRNALVAYSFKSDLERMQAWRKAPILRSGMSDRDYNRVIAAWNAGDLPLLYLHPASAGHGLNLQDGGYDVIIFGLSWGLELYQQLIGRLRRTGQENPHVMVHRILTRGTVEEDLMLPRLAQASEDQRAFLDSFKRYRDKISKRNQVFIDKSMAGTLSKRRKILTY